MNEYSQKIYDLLIEKAKEIVDSGFFKKENPGIPEIIINYSEIPSEYFEQNNLIKTLEGLQIKKERGNFDFDLVNVITSLSVSNKNKKIRLTLSYMIWEQLLANNKKS